MRKEYGKLVRDRIPHIIRQAGGECAVEVMAEEAYVQALKDKLVEEAQEAAAAEPEGLVTELADLCEVVDALISACGIGREAVLVEQQERRRRRGGFGRRLRLLWTARSEG